MIPYGKQSISKEDIDSVVKVMNSAMLTQGNVVPEFESKVSRYCSSKYAVATNNGTSALHVACVALGVGVGDIVWTSPITFVASANCAKYCGAAVDFVDVEENTGLMSISALEEKLRIALKNNKLPKVIIPVHFSGQSCDMEKIYSLSKKYRVRIIEDASHALGANYKNKKVGCCQYSDICIFSFHPVKMITTGEGGMALTNSESLYLGMSKLKSHGISANSSISPWYYEQEELGFNYRMPDLLAALGVSQLQRLDEFIIKRREIARFYIKNIRSKKIDVLHQHGYAESSYHLFPILVNDSQQRLKLYNHLLANNIKCQVHYIPVYKHPYYKNEVSTDYSGAEIFYQSELSIPIYVDISEENLQLIVQKINNF